MVGHWAAVAAVAFLVWARLHAARTRAILGDDRRTTWHLNRAASAGVALVLVLMWTLWELGEGGA